MRTAESINTGIFWVGVQRSSGKNSFDPKFMPILDDSFTVYKVTEAFQKDTSKRAYNAILRSGKPISEFSGSGQSIKEEDLSGNFHVFKIMDIFKLVDGLNSEENRDFLERIMAYDDSRIVTSVATVFKHGAGESNTQEAELVISSSKESIGSPEFTLIGSRSDGKEVKLSDGMVFAYEYSRLCWKKRMER